jgi:hypothetical protein
MDTSTPSNPHAATLTKKSNNLHGIKPTVTLREATATVETFMTFLQLT